MEKQPQGRFTRKERRLFIRMKLSLKTPYGKKLEAIIAHYGDLAQKEKFIEELEELAEALRECDSIYDNHVIEEMADVAIMFNQYEFIIQKRDELNDAHHLASDKFDEIVQFKITRTAKRIREDKGEYCGCKQECKTLGGSGKLPSNSKSKEL